MRIDLPHGGPGAGFDVDDLVEHLRATGRSAIVIGQQNCGLADHTKPRSLDYWLRTHYARSPDTKQATNAVTDALIATGRFEAGTVRCPDSGRRCRALVLADDGDRTGLQG